MSSERRDLAMNVKDKIAIITGAASGIGQATAIELASHGCTMAIIDINEEGLIQTLNDVKKYAPDSTAEKCDISDEYQVKQTIKKIQEHHGRIDILINNAAIMKTKMFTELSVEEFNKHMSVNYYGPINLIRSVIPVMEKQGKGVIINIASVGGRLVVPGTSAYNPSKAAVYAFSEALYYELKDKGIHVGVIVPGGVKTGIFNPDDSKLGQYYESQCTTKPDRIAPQIRKAIEKERWETIVPFSSRFLLLAHDALSGVFKKSLLIKLRPYFE